MVTRIDDEYYVNSPVVRDFVAEVLAARAAERDPSLLVEALRPAFGRLLAAEDWLPPDFPCCPRRSALPRWPRMQGRKPARRVPSAEGRKRNFIPPRVCPEAGNWKFA